MAKSAPLRRLIVDSEKGNDITLNIDIASTSKEKDKLVSIIYEMLFCYSLDLTVSRQKQGLFVIEGLAEKREIKKSVIADIIEAYTDWYTETPTTL